jgi:kynurenine formamidase
MTDVAEKTGKTGNWGRWGTDDERGALNLLTPEVVLRATQVCRTGKVYSLGLPVQAQGVPLLPYRGTPMRLTLTNHTDDEMFTAFGGKDVGANEDVLVLASHNETHMDALCHVHHEGKLYNGFPADSMRTHTGAQRCGIDKARWVAGRAVLLDFPALRGVDVLPGGHVITGDEIRECAAAQGVELRSGDIALLRTGWLDAYLADQSSVPMEAQPGLGLSGAQLLADLDVAAVGADNSAVEAIPFDGNEFLCVHIELLVRRGVPLIEHLVLGEMAQDQTYESLLVVAPLPVTGATGSPVNPIAIG